MEVKQAPKHELSQPAAHLTNNSLPLLTPRSVVFSIIVSAVYLVASYFLVGFKVDQLVLVGLFNALYFSSRTSRRFITAFSIFIVYWILFDYQKAFPNYQYNSVHIADLYNWEKSWFGFNWKGTVVTPNEYFLQNTNAVLDALSGVFYLCWIPLPLAFAAAMFFKNRRIFFEFSLTFFLVNIFGWMGYYGYPAAPPWYVAQYGFDFLPATPGHTAGLARFDALVGAGIFESIYAKSSNVFAAMPSLHAAYMFIVLYYGVKAKLKGWNIVFAIVVAGIWFGAVYTSHHYILDVLAGIICTILGISLFQAWARSVKGDRALTNLVKATSR
jgi:hypothetical protein